MGTTILIFFLVFRKITGKNKTGTQYNIVCGETYREVWLAFIGTPTIIIEK
jgi:hypothetical protein